MLLLPPNIGPQTINTLDGVVVLKTYNEAVSICVEHSIISLRVLYCKSKRVLLKCDVVINLYKVKYGHYYTNKISMYALYLSWFLCRKRQSIDIGHLPPCIIWIIYLHTNNTISLKVHIQRQRCDIVSIWPWACKV